MAPFSGHRARNVPRRAGLPLLAAVVAALVGWPAVPVTPADALGWLVTTEGRTVQPTGLAAVVVWEPRKGEEQLVARLDYRLDGAGATSVGWLLPVPGTPELAEAPGAIFDDLERYAVPREKPISLLRPEVDRVAAPAPARPPVRPRGFDPSSPTGGARFDVEVLPPGDAAALDAWGARYGLRVPASRSEAVRRYLAAGWRFVAARLTAERGVLTGGTTPALRVSFPAAEPLVPLGLAALDATGEPAANRRLETAIYSLGPERLDAGGAFQTNYAEELDPYTALQLTSGVGGGDARFLTRLRATLDANAITADVTLRPIGRTEVGVGRMSPAEWAQAIVLAALIPVFWLWSGFAQSGAPGLAFGAVTVLLALAPMLRRGMRGWWPLVLTLIYLGVAMPSAREVIQRTDLDLAYLAVGVAVGLVLLALWHVRRSRVRPRIDYRLG